MALSSRPATSLKLRAVVLALIVGCYVGIGIWLAQTRPPALAMSIPIVSVDLSPGPSIGLGPAISSPSKTIDTVENSVAAPKEDSKDTKLTTAATVSEPDVTPATDMVDSSLSQSVDNANSQPLPEALALDVLQQVEALVGTTSTVIAADTRALDVATLAGWTASQPGSGGTCGLADTIAANLMADEMAVDELTSYPSALRSVSNAIQLWNGEWLRSKVGSELAMPAVHRVISETVSEGSDDCRQTPLEGPRFVFVSPPGTEPIILVIGSGDWRWTDLQATERPFLSRWFGTRY